jgi:hypothetical protein
MKNPLAKKPQVGGIYSTKVAQKLHTMFRQVSKIQDNLTHGTGKHIWATCGDTPQNFRERHGGHRGQKNKRFKDMENLANEKSNNKKQLKLVFYDFRF